MQACARSSMFLSAVFLPSPRFPPVEEGVRTWCMWVKTNCSQNKAKLQTEALEQANTSTQTHTPPKPTNFYVQCTVVWHAQWWMRADQLGSSSWLWWRRKLASCQILLEHWNWCLECGTSIAWADNALVSIGLLLWVPVVDGSDQILCLSQVWWNWPCSHQLQQDQRSQLLPLRRVRAPCTGMHNWSYSLIIFLCRPSFFWLMVVLFFSESSSLAKGWQIEATPRPVSFTCRVKGGKGWKNQLSAFNYKNVYV